MDNTLIRVIVIAEIIILLMSIVKYLVRERYVKSLLSTPRENRLRILSLYTTRVKVSRFGLIALPFIIVLVPVILYITHGPYLLELTLILILAYLFTIQEYLFHKSVLDSLVTEVAPPAQSESSGKIGD